MSALVVFEITEQFRASMRAAGLTPPEAIEADGELHRFASNGKRSDDAGWYVLHADGIPAGIFGDWRTGAAQAWRADIGRPLAPDEEAAHRRRVEAMRRERDAVRAGEQADAARRAVKIWQAAKPAPENHRYLVCKRIGSHGARLHGDALVIPMRADGKLCSLQYIFGDGEKRFLRAARTAGAYFSIGDPRNAKAICIAEGFATGASIHEATGYPVAVSFYAGNLDAVAQAIREKFPALALIVCADDDRRTEGNPGMTKAKAAARAVGGSLAVPRFAEGRAENATDFNDMAALHGLDAVKQAVAMAHSPDDPEGAASAERLGDVRTIPADEGCGRMVELIRADSVTPEPVQWLWHGWLAAGKLHILGGQPGTGKTTLALALAATITTGGRWSDGTRSERGSVVMWTGEDDPADTLVPRLLACGADATRVHFVGDVTDAEGKRAFDPARDADALRRALCGVEDVRLLIIDPIVSAVAADSHKNAEVRRSLQPLVDLAASLRCAVLGITHFTKGTAGREPIERITGSLAFGALARIVLVAAKKRSDDDGEPVRMLMRAKSNIGADDGAFEYGIEQTELDRHTGIVASRVRWGDAVDGNARTLLADAEQDGEADADSPADVEAFVKSTLAYGPVPARAFKADAEGAGYNWRTVQRAAKRLGAESRKDGMQGGWRWGFYGLPKATKSPEGVEGVSHKSVSPSTSSAPSVSPSMPEAIAQEIEL